MKSLAQWLHLVALAIWLGSIVFFSFAVAPLIFTSLPRAEAGRVVSAIFPVYYVIGYVCGVILLVTRLWLRGRAWSVAVAIAAVMLLLTLYAGLVVQPRAHALRPALQEETVNPAVKAEFDQLHRRAVQLNGAVLVGALLLTVMTARRLRP